MPITIRPLQTEDDRSDFRSGNIELDRFFQRYAGQNQFKHHIGTTYIAVENDVIVGFATVAASQLEIEHLPPQRRRRLPRYPLPVLRLARLATDERAQGNGVGQFLLKAVFVLAQRMSQDFGCIGVVVDAKPEAIGFYQKYGFFELETVQGHLGDRPEPTPMFLEIGAIPKGDDDTSQK